MAHTNEQSYKPDEQINSEFEQNILNSLGIMDRSGRKDEGPTKAEVIHEFCIDFKYKINEHVAKEALNEKRALKHELVFTSYEEKAKYWSTVIAGYAFESVTAAEHRSFDKETRLRVEKEEQEISDILIEIAKHPQDYQILLDEGRRIPDAIFFRIGDNIEINKIGEDKLSEVLNDRALDQISENGSRKTIMLLVDKLNRKFKSEVIEEDKQPVLYRLKTLLNGKNLTVSKDLSIEIIMPSNREIPDVDALNLVAEIGESDQARKQREIRTGAEVNKLNKMVGVTDVKSNKIVEQVKMGKIKFRNSMFSTIEIAEITDTILETSDFDIFFPGEIRSSVSTIASERKALNENLQTPKDRVEHVISEVPDSEQYLKWLHIYMDSGAASFDPKRENNARMPRNLSSYTPKEAVVKHPATGIEGSVTHNLDDSKTKEELIKEADRKLKEQLVAHVSDWRELLSEKLGVPIVKGVRLSEDQRNALNQLFEELKNETKE